jgi:hypothetical protein
MPPNTGILQRLLNSGATGLVRMYILLGKKDRQFNDCWSDFADEDNNSKLCKQRFFINGWQSGNA